MTAPLDEAARQQDLVVVNPPEAFGVFGSVMEWAGNDDPLPRHIRILCSGTMRPTHLYRPDATTLVVRRRRVSWPAGSTGCFVPTGAHSRVATRLFSRA